MSDQTPATPAEMRERVFRLAELLNVQPPDLSAVTDDRISDAALDWLRKSSDSARRCRGCNTTVFWVQHANGRKAPYTRELLNHFVDCPSAWKFRRAATRVKR